MKLLTKARLLTALAVGWSASAALAGTANLAHPGMLNYVEGAAAVDGQALTSKSVGTAEIAAGQTLETQAGKAEILLTPGVFLRVGDHSAVRMENPGLADTRVSVLKGEAMVEATEIHKENNIRISEGLALAKLEKDGLYRFNADGATISVLDGKAEVTTGDRQVTLKKGKELQLNGNPKPHSFDRENKDDLYQWSSLRSKYLADANEASARTIIVNNGGWFGSGWYWNPYFGMYSYLPGSGMFYSPFGYPYYSPVYIVRSPVYGWHRGYVPARPVPGAAVGARGFVSRPAPIARPGFGGGFRGGMSMRMGRMR